MASLTEVYEGGNGAGLRRLYAGVALFGVGAVLLVVAIAVAATELYQLFGMGTYEAREVAGVLGGVGLPTLLLGTMSVLPRARRGVRVGAGVGVLISLAGVYLFQAAYPVDWIGGSGNTSMTLLVAFVYFVGAIVTSWCLFASVASFKARNDPGGTVSLEITSGGRTRVVEVSNDELRGHLSGVGLLGQTPDGDVETQTNRNRGSAARSSGRPSHGGGTAGVTDGGSTSADGTSIGWPGEESSDDRTENRSRSDTAPASVGDAYCGNCVHFRYARTDDGLVPYCGFDGQAMDDMDACDEWTSNT